MARNFADNGTDRVYLGSAVVTAHPLTLACWVNLDTLPGLGNQYAFVGVSNSSSSVIYYFLYCSQFNNWGWQQRIATTFITGGGTAASTGTWTHLAFVVASDTSRTLYVNGSAAADGSTCGAPTGINSTTIGAHLSSLGVQWTTDGSIADVGIWNTNLASGDITELYTNKKSPLLVQKANLVLAAKLRDDLLAYPNLTLSSSGTSVVDSPTDIIYPQDYYRRLLARRAA